MIKPLVVILLALVAFKSYSFSVFSNPGIDFYHFWNVPAALKLGGDRLANPYLRGDQYAQVLNEYSDTVLSDAKLTLANRHRRIPDLTGSPLLYTIFSVLPKDYSEALALFRTFEVVLFFVAIVLLGSLYRYERSLSVTFALVLLLAADHLKNDLALGNINILLLCGLACALTVSPDLRERPFLPTLILSGGFLTGLAFLTLLKPLVFLPCVLLAIGLWQGQNIKTALSSSTVALLSTAVLLLIPCLYFRSWSVWWNWYTSIYGANHQRLFYPVAEGNFSFALIASDWLQVSYVPLALLVLAMLIVSIFLVIIPRRRTERRGWARPGADSAALCNACRNPHFLASMGIVITFALSPLSWIHYYMLLLIPGWWLASLSAMSHFVALLGLTALIMSSGALDHLFIILQWGTLIPVARALSWLPAWIGILLFIRAYAPAESSRRSVDPQGPSAPVTAPSV